MKVSKLKTLLFLLGAVVIFSGVTVDAASLSINKSSEKTEENIIKYEIYLDATEGEFTNDITVTFNTDFNKATLDLKNADNVDVKCGATEYCLVKVPFSGNKKIAEMTVTNNTKEDIVDFTFSVSSTNIGNVSSEAITIKPILAEEIPEKEKSTNTELSNITFSVSSATLSPAFTVEGRSYTVTGIKDTVNSITISTTCENCATTFTCIDKCSISENKNNRIMLESGANEVELVTTSEDGKNTATYNFIIYRGEVEEPSAYLKDLKIEGIELDTKFDMLLNEYTTTVDMDVEKLNINYELEDPEAKVVIKGHEKLIDGENIVTITVTSSDGESKQVYTITVNKEEICDPETEDCDNEETASPVVVEKKKSNKLWLIIGLVVGGLLIIGISGYFIFRKNKKDKNDKNNKSDKNNKIKKEFIEEETEDKDEIVINELPELNEEIIQPKVKPSVDEALDDLMKTKEIELNNL